MTVEQDVVNYDISALNSYTFADLSEIKRNLETTLTDLFGKLDQVSSSTRAKSKSDKTKTNNSIKAWR
ncbi:unnamed protein product [Kuraishia capsulata CBS 1993]|uniref:Uncharacterized protein n=1 Tax=Kuraishia capsulata CBS 1993 TaxID=1382522 RepID=W6MN69_9ASCO|nr:uncharacterized protein KUCA_T00002449001 [Kuraishia capsulata CBS 1993]CDK26477.1 unnamed protein product [Kuraishia capsulata CBS 1993]